MIVNNFVNNLLVMSYLLLRVADRWITNNDSDFYMEDTGKYCGINKLCTILFC